jgi:hypothetical protein
MISRIEHIGQPSQSSWPKRLRRWLNDLFGSRYAQLLERDLLQARLERDRALLDLKATQERLIEVMAATKGIPWRPVIPAEIKKNPTVIPPTQWQQIQAEAIAENARLEAEDAEKRKTAEQAKEN